MRILEDKTISARRVDDDSILDEHRISVVWTAPNQWSNKGSRYGTVQFTFDFAELIEGRNLYWVEGVDGRSLDTCRMLISDKDVKGLPLKRYDPQASRGPLRLMNGEWFWKSDLEFELMIHGDLPLSQCRAVDAIVHNRNHCSRGSAYRCDEVTRNEIETAARLLAGALGGQYKLPYSSFVEDDRVSLLLQRGWTGILDALDNDIDGSIRRKEEVDLVMAAALARLSSGNSNVAADLASLISSQRRVRSSLKRMLNRRAKVQITSPHGQMIYLAEAVPTGREALLVGREGNTTISKMTPQ